MHVKYCGHGSFICYYLRRKARCRIVQAEKFAMQVDGKIQREKVAEATSVTRVGAGKDMESIVRLRKFTLGAPGHTSAEVAESIEAKISQQVEVDDVAGQWWGTCPNLVPRSRRNEDLRTVKLLLPL